MELTKVLAKLNLLVDVKLLLVSENDNKSSSDQESQLIFLSVIKSGKINTSDFSTNFGVDVNHRSGISEKVGVVIVGISQESLILLFLEGDRRKLDVGEGRAKKVKFIRISFGLGLLGSDGQLFKINLTRDDGVNIVSDSLSLDCLESTGLSGGSSNRGHFCLSL